MRVWFERFDRYLSEVSRYGSFILKHHTLYITGNVQADAFAVALTSRSARADPASGAGFSGR